MITHTSVAKLVAKTPRLPNKCREAHMGNNIVVQLQIHSTYVLHMMPSWAMHSLVMAVAQHLKPHKAWFIMQYHCVAAGGGQSGLGGTNSHFISLAQTYLHIPMGLCWMWH